MADLDAHKIDPPDTHAPAASIDCPECGARLEVGYDLVVDTHGGECPHCHTEIDGDAIHDQLTAQAEPPEWG